MLMSGREVINEPNYFITAAIFIIGANNTIFR